MIVCNGCCIKDLKWENGVLQMLKGGQWQAVPGEATVKPTPSLPTPDPDTPPSQDFACWKANGLWAVIENFTDALILSITGLDLTPIAAYNKFRVDYGGKLRADNFKAWEFFASHYTDDPDAGVAWNEYKDSIKADFICAAQYALDKFVLLSDNDLKWLFAYDFDSPSAVIDDFLTDMLTVPEGAEWRESASYHSFSQIGECDCSGSTPPPPIPDGFGVIKVYFGQAFNANVFPDSRDSADDTIENGTLYGELLSPTSIGSTSGASLAGNQGISAIYEAPAGVRITAVKYTFQWAGSASSGESFDLGQARAADAEETWTLITEGNIPASAVTTPDTTPVVDLSAHTVRYFWHNYAAFGTDASDNGAMVISNIRFDLAAIDGSWTRINVPLGTAFPL